MKRSAPKRLVSGFLGNLVSFDRFWVVFSRLRAGAQTQHRRSTDSPPRRAERCDRRESHVVVRPRALPPRLRWWWLRLRFQRRAVVDQTVESVRLLSRISRTAAVCFWYTFFCFFDFFRTSTSTYGTLICIFAHWCCCTALYYT